MSDRWRAITRLPGRVTGIAVAAVTLSLSLAASSPVISAAGQPGSGPACGQWTIVPNPASQTVYSGLTSVAAAGPADVWAVGSTTTDGWGGGRPLIEHWDGSVWKIVPGPAPQHSWNTAFLNGVGVISSDDVWAVGLTDFNQTEIRSRAEHWNGTRWLLVPRAAGEPLGTLLMAVAGTASNDVWAVGDDGASTVIEHWDGSGWSVVPSPNPVSNARNRLSGVVALSPSNAYAVGTATTGYVASRPGSPLASNPAGAILLHWNGTAWKAIDMAGLGGNQIRAISASGLRDVWLAGAFDVGTDHVELAAHGHGATWSPTTTVRMGTGGVPLGIAGRTAGDVWLVGAYNRRAYPYTERTMVQHYDGASWQGIRSPNAGPNDTRLNGVAVAGSTVWAVGSYWDDAFNGHALIEGYC